MCRSLLVVAVLVASVAGCATTGSTFRSGTGDTYLGAPPFYAGRIPSGASSPADGVLILPVAWQGGAVNPPSFDPGDSPELRSLLAAMDHFLAEEAPRGAVGPHTRDAGTPGVPPDVRFGCEADPGMDEGWPTDQMLLAVGRPSPEWAAWVAERMGETGASYALLLTLEVGEYRARQKGWRGDKEVQLGTGHSVSLPWLTSLEGPVSVLQITGALVTPDGRAVRIGAEGVLARRTGIIASSFGLQALIGDGELASLETLRRQDLPGEPLAWQVAMRSLLERLLEAPGSP